MCALRFSPSLDRRTLRSDHTLALGIWSHRKKISLIGETVNTEKWLVEVGEETLEVSLDDLRALILDGRVKLTDRVKKGALNWIEARHPPALSAAFADRHASLSEVPPPAASSDSGVPFEDARDANDAFGIYAQSHSPAIAESIINARCRYHPDVSPAYICKACRTPFCRDCTKVVGPQTCSICALCGSLCLPYDEVRQKMIQLADRRSGFGWHDLKLALRYPFREPVTLSITAVIYGASHVMLPYLAAPGYGYLLAGIGLLPVLVVNAVMFGCMTLVISHIAAGRLSYKRVFDLTSLLADPQEMFSLSAAILLVTTGPLLLSWRFASNHPAVLAVALCWLLCYYPLAVLVAGETQLFTATINPLTGLKAIGRIGGSYWKLFLMYLGLMGLTGAVGGTLLILVIPHHLLMGLGVIWLPVLNLLVFLPLSIVLGLLVFYTNIVIAFLIGRILFKSADEDLF
jgi:hypothetical protein